MSHNDLQFLPEVPPADVRQAELIDLVARFAPADGLHETLIAPLHLLRASAPAQRLPSVYEPGLCVAVQGCKQVMLNGEAFRYDPLHFLVISVTLPIMGQIVEATLAKPYLCVRLNIDPREVGALMLEAGESEPQGAGAQHGLRFASAGRGLHVSSVERGVRSSSAERGVRLSGAERGLRVLRVSDPLLDAVLRLLRLLRTPQDVRVLAPLAVREIYYRVLMSDLGPSLRELAVADSQSHRIARAIDLLKRRYAEPVRVEELAETAHMSSSSLHHHFKLVT